MTKLNNSANLPDPVVTEIVRNAVVAITEEMKSNLMRTAYNMIIYEALDFTVGLFDAKGNTVSIGIGLPMFIRGMSNTVKRMIAKFDEQGLDDGDVLLTNEGGNKIPTSPLKNYHSICNPRPNRSDDDG